MATPSTGKQMTAATLRELAESILELSRDVGHSLDELKDTTSLKVLAKSIEQTRTSLLANYYDIEAMASFLLDNSSREYIDAAGKIMPETAEIKLFRHFRKAVADYKKATNCGDAVVMGETIA